MFFNGFRVFKMFNKKAISILIVPIISALTIGSIVSCTDQQKPKNTQELVTNFNNTWAKTDDFIGQVKAKEIKETSSAMFHLVEMESGGSGYISNDGRYLIGGPIMIIENGKIVELGEEIRIKETKKLINVLDLANSITLKPSGEVKQTIYVFTDPTCPSCQAFHSETEKLLNNGVQIHYLPWVRTPESKKIINDVWCATDKLTAYEKAIKSEKFETTECANPLEKNIKVGQKLNVQATPTIFTKDGSVVTGAVPADELLKFLKLDNPTTTDESDPKK